MLFQTTDFPLQRASLPTRRTSATNEVRQVSPAARRDKLGLDRREGRPYPVDEHAHRRLAWFVMVDEAVN